MTFLTPTIIDDEIDFAFACILKVKNNESAWNYVTGILEAFPLTLSTIKAK
jgi:hypothetical protein